MLGPTQGSNTSGSFGSDATARLDCYGAVERMAPADGLSCCVSAPGAEPAGPLSHWAPPYLGAALLWARHCQQAVYEVRHWDAAAPLEGTAVQLTKDLQQQPTRHSGHDLAAVGADLMPIVVSVSRF